MTVPDPNHFDGDVRLFTAGEDEWTVLPPRAGYVDAGRGVGLLDLAGALTEKRPHRASAEVALHVLDVMESVQAGVRSGEFVAVQSTCRRPDPVPGLVELG